MQPVFVSIIIPTFNSERTLQNALQSILRQKYVDFEVLVMDGGSQDKTLEVAMSLRDDRLKIWNEKDEGIYDAMNKGIDKASGEWLYFMGSDDMLLNEDVLSKVFDDPTNRNQDILYGQVLLESTNTLYLGEFNAEKLIFQNISHQAIFFRRSLLMAHGKFNLKYKTCADHIYNIRWYFDKSVKKKYIGTVIAKFGQEGVSSKTNDRDKVRDLPAVVRQYGGPMVYFRFYVLRPWTLKIRNKLKLWRKLYLHFVPITI